MGKWEVGKEDFSPSLGITALAVVLLMFFNQKNLTTNTSLYCRGLKKKLC